MIINSYKYNLDVVLQLQKLIDLNYKELFTAVLVHGSIATDQVIGYSDFDGLLIIKDNYLNSRKLKSFKRDSMKIILKFDPLQHHGWFQIKESQLLDYPENYLPLAVLKYSKCIYPLEKDLELKIDVKSEPDFKSTLYKMLNNIENKAVHNWVPKNIYQLKGFLSQLMLIPCLYYSAKNMQGIFKGESFHAVKKNFSKKEWQAIEIASNIRKEWNPKLNFMQKRLLQNPNKLIRRAVIKFFPINKKTKHMHRINSEFYDSVLALIKKIKNEII